MHLQHIDVFNKSRATPPKKGSIVGVLELKTCKNGGEAVGKKGGGGWALHL
jgi:hypothetical protein